MTTKLEAAFKKVSALSPELQDMIAEQMLADLQSDPSTLRRGSPSKLELHQRLQKLELMAKESNAPEADFARDSIYSGNLDDTR